MSDMIQEKKLLLHVFFRAAKDLQTERDDVDPEDVRTAHYFFKSGNANALLKMMGYSFDARDVNMVKKNFEKHQYEMQLLFEERR